MTMQRTIHDRLRPSVAPPSAQAGPGTSSVTASSLGLEASEVDRLVSELQLGLKDVSELYNDFAQPLKVWMITLIILCFYL